MSKKIAPAASCAAWLSGLEKLTADFDFVIDAAGTPVEWEQAEGLSVRYDGSKAVIACSEKIHFFRLFVILLDRMDAGAFTHSETAHFDKAGAMFDCSRNAVVTVDAFKGFLRRMAAMGLNLVMLYTEETYTVPGYPYFGYLRGRYTPEELRALDDYADAFGIEMIPCIQTLAHLAQFLRWPAAGHLADTPDILLCEDETVHKFVRDCIAAATSCFRSNRIHLGMDEAHGIGSGRYLKKHGYKDTTDIISAHLTKVGQICAELGVEPMIWSDMCLRPLSPTDDYYDFSGNMQPITPEHVAKMPADIGLVYWDYYQHSKQSYLTMIERHQLYPNKLIFAGGVWNWSGPTPDHGKTVDTTVKALAACREKGIKEVFATMWGDNGAESSITNTLLGMQLYAENTYGSADTIGDIADAFRRCCGGVAQDFYDLRLLDELPGVPQGNPIVATPTKQVLYQDVLMGLFDKHFALQCEMFGSMKQWYRERSLAIKEAAGRNPGYAVLFEMYAALADVLADKAEVGLEIHAAYAAGDRAAMAGCIAALETLVKKYSDLTLTWEALWMSTNKPFGFDVISSRLGATGGRMAYAAHRLADWMEGRVDALPEVAEEQLFFDGRTEPLVEGSPLLCNCTWSRIITACPMG